MGPAPGVDRTMRGCDLPQELPERHRARLGAAHHLIRLDVRSPLNQYELVDPFA